MNNIIVKKLIGILLLFILIGNVSAWAVINPISKEDYNRFEEHSLYFSREHIVKKCLNSKNINSINNINENLILNDDFLIEFATKFASYKSFHSKKMEVQTIGSETIHLIPASLVEELCETYFNRKPSKSLEKNYIYQQYPCVYKDQVSVVYNEVYNSSFDFENEEINLKGFVLQIPTKIYKTLNLNNVKLWHDKNAINNISCTHCFEAKVKYKNQYMTDFYFTTHEITKEEYELFRKDYIKDDK